MHCNCTRPEYSHMPCACQIGVKRPHKCPVCDATGKTKRRLTLKEFLGDYWLALDDTGRVIVDCHACNGRGVLWG